MILNRIVVAASAASPLQTLKSWLQIQNLFLNIYNLDNPILFRSGVIKK
jgi:hypothetical protein